MARNTVEDFIIDFSKEESGGGRARYKEGTYRMRIIAAKPTTSSQKDTPGLELTLQFLDGKYKGKKLTETLWASPKAYSRFRTLLEAIGKKVPAKVNLVRIAKAVKGEELYFELEDDAPREGYKARTVVSFNGFISEDDFDPDEDTDDEDDDLEDDEDEEEDEEEEEEDEEEEEEPVRAKKRTRKAKPTAKTATKSKRKKAADDDDDDLEDLDLDEF